MKEIIDYLRRLQAHNERTWFVDHKEEYVRCQGVFNGFVEQLIAEIAKFDKSVAGNTASTCTYRIYRDVRFSQDKSPYKTHLGAFICPGGKKSGFAGYYFHMGVGGEGYPNAHMLATGNYCFEPQVVKLLREDIVNGEGDFDRVVKTASAFSLDDDNALTRNPKGYATDAPYGEYLRLRTYCLNKYVDNDFMLDDHLLEHTAELFRTTQPFLEYINRAIAYARERF